jgi:hypothetical protein
LEDWKTDNNNLQPVTRNAKKGFSGMRNSSPALILLYLDSDVLRNPFQAIVYGHFNPIFQQFTIMIVDSRNI